MTSQKMFNSSELTFLYECGHLLRDRLFQMQATADEPHNLQRVARSLLLDFLGDNKEMATPIFSVLEQLLSLRTGGSKEATLAAIQQQLKLIYNSKTSQKTVAFACGFVGFDATTALNQVRVAALTPVEIAPIASTHVTVRENLSSFNATGLSPVSQYFILLVTLGSIALIIFLVIQRLSAPGPAQIKQPLITSAPLVEKTTITTKADQIPSIAVPAADTTMLYDAGLAVGGQRILLDLSSLRKTDEDGQTRFRYMLGNQSIDALADCKHQSWTTYPEAQSHSPQSAATVRMLERVCNQSLSLTLPTRSTSGTGIVFDPPSNIRATPNGAILCSVTSRGTIPIQGRDGDWYRTDFCGTPGFIHRGQLRF